MNLRNFFKGNPRTVKAKKNIAASFCLKGIDAVVYLLLVPVTLDYLNPYEYGIWLTLNSVLMWINTFDIGLGNGLRNKLATAIAQNNKKLGKIYVSTTFLMLIILMGSVIVIGSILQPFINWYDILNTSPDRVRSLDSIVYLAFLIFCLNFIFKIIGNIYLAMQLPAVNNAMVVTGHLLSLIVIFILTKTTQGSLLWVALTYSASPLLVYLIAYPITFWETYPFLRPSLKDFKRIYLKDLFNIGVQFFILQLSGIILFALANLLISHMFGPEKVTPYSVAYRYFSLLPMVMTLILAPLWSATTDAYAKGDEIWIKQTIHTIKKILGVAAIFIIVMIVLAPWVYQIWIGGEVHISEPLSCIMGIYVFILISSLAFSSILNGIGKLRLQTLNTVIMALLFIPVCYYLGKHYEIIGIVAGMCIVNSSGLILNYLQVNKLINHTAKGIWAQ
ncbi:MAG: oligosaccharide flippase family protein [Muribaculaceae bacterium]|nr:oligosaccharide flippase family protein [Muribaculaceae bacterium]